MWRLGYLIGLCGVILMVSMRIVAGQEIDCPTDDIPCAAERLIALMDRTYPDDMLPLSGEWRVLFATCSYTEPGAILEITVAGDGRSIQIGNAEYRQDTPGLYRYLGTGWWFLKVLTPTLIEFTSDTYCERRLEWVTPAE